MRKAVPFALVVVVASALSASAAEEKPLRLPVVSLGLFKNGLAVVQHAATVDGPGVYRVEDVPEPVHGTFWVESDAAVTTRMTRRVVESPLGKTGAGSFQEELAGREVVVHFADQGIPPASGTVMDIEPPRGSAAWNRAYEEPRWGYYPTNYGGGRPGPGRMLVLKTKDGLAYVETSRIAYLDAKGQAQTVRQRKPVMLLTVGPMKEKKATIAVSYLAKGMAWAPSYRVDISDPKTLVLQQSAALKNELGPFEDTEIRLISGFPSIHFAHVTSPASLNTTWAAFFQQLNQRFAPGHASMSNVATQQAVSFNEPGPGRGIDLSAIPTGEGVDLHYQSIGRQTLDEGDSLVVETASAKAAYERIVEWTVPDTRQADGRYVEDYQRQNEPDKFQDAVWDAVRFRNPLEFAMTTAPAMVVSAGLFNGQQMSYWVNPGEETTLRVTKALSIRARSVEHEVEGGRDVTYIAGVTYRRSVMEGELRANNHRKEPVTLVIRRKFSGELVKADGEPKCVLLEEGATYVNKRNQLTWSLTLKPGEEVKLTYRYTLMVRH